MSATMSPWGERGFSLLELVVALALVSFIAVAMLGGVSFGARAWEKTNTAVEGLERVQAAQSLLRTLLQRAHPRDFDPGVGPDPDLFGGTREALAFAAVAPSAFGDKGLTRFRVLIERVEEGERLVLAWQGATARAGRRHTIIGFARAISFAYAKRGDKGGLVWTEAWHEQSGAPDAVMVRAAFDAKSDLRWPDLIVRTRIMRDPACHYDFDTFTCRHG